MIGAVLSIYYKGKKKPEPQGKLFHWNDELIYLADMTPAKWIREGKGYAIADQILESFKKVDIKPLILYRRKDLHTIYKAEVKDFKSHAWKVNWSNHEQWVLAEENWGYHDYFDDEPTNFSRMTVDNWVRINREQTDPDEYMKARLRMKEMFFKHEQSKTDTNIG